jgi:hypothetical protein
MGSGMDEQAEGSDEFYGTALLRVPGVREYVRTVTIPGRNDAPMRISLQYLGADDQWHDTEGSPLAMGDVIAARGRSIAERRGYLAATLSQTSEPELSIEDARKVARLVRRMIPEQPYRSLLDAGARAMLAREWPHLDWELQGHEIIPFARADASDVDPRTVVGLDATHTSKSHATLEAAVEDYNAREERSILDRIQAASEVIIDGVRVKSPDLRQGESEYDGG